MSDFMNSRDSQDRPSGSRDSLDAPATAALARIDVEGLKAAAEKAPHKTWAAFTDDSGPLPHTNLVSFVGRTECVLAMPGFDKYDPLVAYLWAAQPAAILELIAQRAALVDMVEELVGLMEAASLDEIEATVAKALALLTSIQAGDAA